VGTGGYYLVTGKRFTIQSAYRLFYRALRTEPAHAWAWEGLANLLDIDGRYEEAKHAARRAIRYGDDPCAKAILARVLAQLGKSDEARLIAEELKGTALDNDFALNIADDVLKGNWDPLE
jgi:tetratricopeptide (TPR) repeat protein